MDSSSSQQTDHVLLGQAMEAMRAGNAQQAETTVGQMRGFTLQAVLDLYRSELEIQAQQLTESLQVTEKALTWYAEVLRRLPMPMLSLDDRGLVVELNERAEACFGPDLLSSRQAKAIRRLFLNASDDLRFREAVAGLVSEQGLTTVSEVELACANGQTMWADLKVMRMPEREDGRDVCYLCFLDDRTQQVLAERARSDAADAERRRDLAESANAAKTEFLSRVSHELRTPLNAVLGFSHLMLLPSGDLSAKSQTQLRHIQDAGKHLFALVDEVLEINKAESGNLSLEMGAVDVGKVARHVMDLHIPMAAALDLHTSVEAVHAEQLLLAYADARRVREVLTNLINNAVKYNRRGGFVRVVVSQDDQFVRVAVVDGGLGMSAAQQAHLFEPFNRLGAEQLRIAGHGLGLTISRKLAEALGGQLQAVSEVDVGSTFTLLLRRWDRPH